jgi:hypothetical protein
MAGKKKQPVLRLRERDLITLAISQIAATFQAGRGGGITAAEAAQGALELVQAVNEVTSPK